MDEDLSLSDESDKEFKKMENDIDVFLSNIRENVSKNTGPQNEATCSRTHNEYDAISSDEMENESHPQPLPSTGDEPSVSSHATKLSQTSSSSKKKKGWKQRKWKDHQVNNQWRNNGRGFRQREVSGPGEEYNRHMRPSSSRRYDYSPQDYFSPRREEEYDWPHSPREEDELHQERGPSRSVFGRESDEYFQEASLSPEERHHQEEGLYSREGRGYSRRIISVEEEEQEHSRDSYDFNETFNCRRISRSRSSGTESMYHKIYEEESDSPGHWYDDYEDQNTNPYWRHEDDDDAFVDDYEDDQGSAGTMNTASLLTACLEKVVSFNPEIAEKFSRACMSLLNKPVGRTYDSDYEHEESSCASFVDQSGRDSRRSWRDSRSPSFSKSLGSFSGPSRHRSHRDRYEGNSRRIVVECSQSPSPERGHSSDKRYKARYSSAHDKRSTASTSQTLSTKKRSFTNHHKRVREEDPKTSVYRSIRKIRKQCEQESNSTVRRALLALLKVHQRECDMYLKKPDAHPDYNKEYRLFLEKKSKSITDLGGDPNEYNFQEDWKKYWPTQLVELFTKSWEMKMHKCTSMLLKKGYLSKSLSTSSRKDVTNAPPAKKQKVNKHGSERVNKEKSQPKSEEVKSLEQDGSQAASAAQCEVKKEEMDTELLSILKLLKHIKHKFKDCEASFDSFYEKALSIKQMNLHLCDILPSNLPFLEKIDQNLEETLKDENLTLIQKAIIQETHERFKCFLKKTKEINSQCMKNDDNRDKNSVCAEQDHQVQCHVRDLHPCVVTSLRTGKVVPPHMCNDSNLQVCRPVRTLTEVSIQGLASRHAASVERQEKYNDLSQPPPPGVTPPPPGVTPPPIGVIPPLPGVTLSSPLSVTSTPPLSVTSTPPPSVTSTPPPSTTSTPPPSVTSTPPPSVTLTPPLNVTSTPPLSVTSTPPLSVTSTPSAVPPSHIIKSPPHHTTPVSSISSVVPPSHSSKSPPHHVRPTSSYDTTIPLDITVPSPGITPPPPGVTPPPPPTTSHVHQSGFTPSQASCPGLHLKQSSDEASKTKQHPSTLSTSEVQSSKSLNDKDKTTSQRRTVQQPSKEFLRTTIRDCFVSTYSPSTGRDGSTSLAKESITLDNKEESAVSSMPSLPEDILRMFVVKPENKSVTNANDQSSNKISISGNDTKPAAKKRIKITIPQSSKGKSMPSFNPILDDQELL